MEGWTLHTWDLVERQAPPEILAESPNPEEARKNILMQTIENSVAISERKLRSILRWRPAELSRSIGALMDAGLISEVQVEGEAFPWLSIC